MRLAFHLLCVDYIKKGSSMPRQVNDPAQEELLKGITSFLSKAKIPYMVTGALSVIFYGRPRASHDIDIVVEAKIVDTKRVLKAFASLPHKEFLIDPS